MDTPTPGPAPRISVTLAEWQAIDVVLTAQGSPRARDAREAMRPEGPVDPDDVKLFVSRSKRTRSWVAHQLHRAARRAGEADELIAGLAPAALHSIAQRLLHAGE